jgi:hypothetical protein
MNELCKKDCDIIITGSQSGTVPYDSGNLIQYNLHQYEFLMGTQPDAVVLCVNPIDETEYIARTMRFIESGADCTVIALVVFPMDIKDDWTGIYGQRMPLSVEKYENIKKELNSLFSVPIYRLGEKEDIAMLADTITTYFEG